MERVTEAHLARAVAELSRSAAHGLVTSRQVKDWLSRRGIDWGEGVNGYSGKYLNEVDKIICQRGGRLQRWKKNPAIANSSVGWSLADPASVATAARVGWSRVCWEPGRAEWLVLR
jgi:hypothetical protein